MSKIRVDKIFRSIRQYGISFLFLNVIALFFVYVIYPIISNNHDIPIEVCYFCGELNYFSMFGLELVLLLTGSILGLFASHGIIRLLEMMELEVVFKFFSAPFTFIVLMFTPVLIFFIQLENGKVLMYDSTIPTSLGSLIIYLLFILMNYSFLLLMHERGKYLENPREYRPLLILARKTPYFINYWIIITNFLNLPFSGRSFARDSHFAFTPRQFDRVGNLILNPPITIQVGILIFSLLILILQLFFSISHHLIHREEIYDEKNTILKNKVSVAKRIPFYSIMLFLFLVYLIQQIYLSSVEQLEQLETNFLFLQNPYYISYDIMNSPPSAVHWFGTDMLGRDLFAIVVFSFSSFLLVIYLFSIIKFRISMDFMNVTSDYVTTSTKKETFQVIGNIPNLPVLVLIAVSMKFFETSFLFYMLIVLYLSFFSWAKVADLMERNNLSDNRKKVFYLSHPIILYTMSSLILDLSLLSFLFYIPGNLAYGNILPDSLQNQPYDHWWGTSIPLAILVLFVSFLRSSKLRT